MPPRTEDHNPPARADRVRSRWRSGSRSRRAGDPAGRVWKGSCVSVRFPVLSRSFVG